jgi:hypothetical protein
VPTREGTFTFSVKGVDNEGNPLKQTYRIKVGPPEPLTDTTESQLPGGAVGEAYAANFFLSGGLASMRESMLLVLKDPERPLGTPAYLPTLRPSHRQRSPRRD